LSIPYANKIDMPSVHPRRAARRRFRLHVDAVEQVVEGALVDGDARGVTLDLGQPAGAYLFIGDRGLLDE
jgi:hypothetical protein